MSAIDSSAAAALVAAAAGSLPPETPIEAVRARAFELLRLVPDVVERADVLAECRAVTGILASAEESKGRGVITIHATMGTPKRGQEVIDGRPVEYVRTAWLNEPAGKALFEHARSLVGRHCRFGKWTEQVSAELKVSMVEWIEDLGPAPRSASGSSTVPDGPETGSPRLSGDAGAYDAAASAPAAALQRRDAPAPTGPVALCSDSYRKAILSMAKQLLIAEDKRDTFARWRTANGIPLLNDASLTAEQAARVRTFLAGMTGMYDQGAGAA